MGVSASSGAVLVTGGAGFVGSHFVRLLVESGRRVIVLDDLSGGAPARPPGDAVLLRGDIGDAALVRQILCRERIGAVAHFAGRIQVGESMRVPELYFDVNVARTLRLLDAVRIVGVTNFLFSSTAAVYGVPDQVPIPESARLAPINPYGATKLLTEHALEAYGKAHGLRWAALRYFNAAGAHPDGSIREAHDPETHLIPLAIDAAMGRTPPLQVFGSDYDTADGTCVRDYIHVCDLADAHLAALAMLERGESVGAVNLGVGRGHTVRQVLDTVSQIVGKPVPHALAPRRAGDPARLVADPTLARARFGWSAVRPDLSTIVDDAARSRRSVAPSAARCFGSENLFTHATRIAPSKNA
jgi:UDP-glucose-4-epimerase GalE